MTKHISHHSPRSTLNRQLQDIVTWPRTPRSEISFDNVVDTSPKSQKKSHWSIAWSDLMMTMFILFLLLFVYQRVQNDILIREKNEIIESHQAEKARRARLDRQQTASLPFPLLPDAASEPGTMKKNQNSPLQEFDAGDIDFAAEPAEKSARQKPLQNMAIQDFPEPVAAESMPVMEPAAPILTPRKDISDTIALKGQPAILIGQEIPDKTEVIAVKEEVGKTALPAEDILEPRPLSLPGEEPTPQPPALETTEQPAAVPRKERADDAVDTLYVKGRDALNAFALNKFASIELVPEKAVHIVLTGDLLFRQGQATLSETAVNSLEKIGMAIRDTDKTIHVEGHTDDLPIKSGQFANNWELSLARANAVAGFLIREMLIPPRQIIVSGFSSYRPVVPNDSVENRAKNRRVEIVISKEEQNI